MKHVNLRRPQGTHPFLSKSCSPTFHSDLNKSADSTDVNKFIKRAGQNHERRKRLNR